MSTKRNNELEDRFQDQNDRLLDFYDEVSQNIPDEEEDSLLPILNSLNETEERYEEIGPIAEGGEKKITRVFDHRLNRQVAMARAVKAKSRQDQEQFLREAQLEANLAHPNIVPVHNMGFDSEGVPFFTMELIPGDSLKKIIRKLREGDEAYKQNYPMDTLLNMYLKICDAVAYAHSRNVLHLDIKPDNIRVGGFGEVFICDWGLARVLFENEPTRSETPGELDGDVLNDMTLSGIIKGTPGFMAPEQAKAGGKKTFQTDVYALGVLLYMLLTYELPVQGDSGNEILQNTSEGKIIAPHSRKKERIIPHSLAAVAMKALALNPNDRYGSVVEIHQEISRYLAGFPTTAERAGVIASLSLLVKRHNRISFLLMFFLLVMAVVISANLVTIRKEKAEAVAARERAEKNFQLYRDQQKEAIKLGSELSDSTEYATKSKDYSKAKQMIRALEIGLDKNPDPAERKELLLKKGTLHFVLQQFNQATQCFDEAGEDTPTNNDTWRLSKAYVKIKPNDGKLLTLQQLADLVSDAQGNNKAVYYIYFHHMQKTHVHNPEHYLPLAEAMLDKLNKVKADPNRTPLILQKKEEGYHLDLTTSLYLTYSLSGAGLNSQNVLEPFNLHSLDISHSPLQNLSELGGLQLEELRMVGLNFGRKNMLPKQTERLGIKRIIIDSDAYPPAVIKKLKLIHEVIDEKNEGYPSR
jgi:tRNA A-37 threonylcarbamoyl transferase component Bud32/tetratricopeptide (TPR) repeat protein